MEVKSLLQLTTDKFSELFVAMSQCQKETAGPVCAVLVKPPETIMVYLSAQGQIALFDSHQRPHHDGAAILTFDDTSKLQDYLQMLFAAPPAMQSPTGFGM